MSYLATRTFWLATIERAVKTLAQTGAAILGADATGLITVDWGQLASVAGLAAALSVLTSIASGPASPAGTPGLVAERPEPDEPYASL